MPRFSSLATKSTVVTTLSQTVISFSIILIHVSVLLSLHHHHHSSLLLIQYNHILANFVLQTPPKAPIQTKTMEPECKTLRSIQQKDEEVLNQSSSNNEVLRKPVTPDHLRVPKAFKYPERYTSPTDMMISPVTKGLLARSRKCGALLPPGKSLAKIPDLQPQKMGLFDNNEPMLTDEKPCS